MRLLYLPNEPTLGWQVGGRDALARLRDERRLDALDIYSFRQPEPRVALREILERVDTFKPDVVLFTKIGTFPVDDEWFRKLSAMRPRPMVVYYDGDIYGRIFKRPTPQTRTMARNADLVLLCGLGDNAALFMEAGATQIRHLRHNASSRQFVDEWTPTETRELDVVFIGNRIVPRISLQSRVRWGRMPGAYERDELVAKLGERFGSRFAVFGNGWDGFVGNRGPVAFDQQHSACRRSWVTVGYDHFPGIPFYFSDRLPIALLSGVAHISHYHPGYETLFQNGRELLWAHDVDGLVELTQFALSRGPAFLQRIADAGRQCALANLTTEVVFGEVLETIASLHPRRGERAQR